MKTRIVYTIPENLMIVEHGVIEQLIKAIPKDWTLRTGMLVAPYEMTNTNETLPSTHLHFGSPIDQMILGVNGEAPDILGILVGQKKPREVHFGNHASLEECEVLPPWVRVAVACHFIQLRYRGRLRFASGTEDASHAAFTCEIFLPDGRPRKLATVTIEADGADDPRALSIFLFCKKVLEPFTPQPRAK